MRLRHSGVGDLFGSDTLRQLQNGVFNRRKTKSIHVLSESKKTKRNNGGKMTDRTKSYICPDCRNHLFVILKDRVRCGNCLAEYLIEVSPPPDVFNFLRWIHEEKGILFKRNFLSKKGG